MINASQVELIALSRTEISCLLAALNFTKPRTEGISWEERDEAILQRLKKISRNFGVIKT